MTRPNPYENDMDLMFEALYPDPPPFEDLYPDVQLFDAPVSVRNLRPARDQEREKWQARRIAELTRDKLAALAELKRLNTLRYTLAAITVFGIAISILVVLGGLLAGSATGLVAAAAGVVSFIGSAASGVGAQSVHNQGKEAQKLFDAASRALNKALETLST